MAPSVVSPAPPKQEPYRRPVPRIGRNAACPCKSGRKFKQCHGTRPSPGGAA